jgi:hypothetical protein
VTELGVYGTEGRSPPARVACSRQVTGGVRRERGDVVGWKAEARRIYENRVIDDALGRLRGAGLKHIPLSQSELRTLAVRTRQAIFGSPSRGNACKDTNSIWPRITDPT